MANRWLICRVSYWYSYTRICTSIIYSCSTCYYTWYITGSQAMFGSGRVRGGKSTHRKKSKIEQNVSSLATEACTECCCCAIHCCCCLLFFLSRRGHTWTAAAVRVVVLCGHFVLGAYESRPTDPNPNTTTIYASQSSVLGSGAW